MRKAVVFAHETRRVTRRHGARAVLCFESELPVGESVAARHARALSEALLAHAEREYLPVAARELEDLVGAGRGFAFTPHRVVFRARIASEGAGLCMQLSLLYTVGGEVRAAQRTQSFWTADGTYRCRRAPRGRKSKSAVEKSLLHDT